MDNGILDKQLHTSRQKKLPAHNNYEQGVNDYICETITSRKQQPDGWMYYPEHPYR